MPLLILIIELFFFFFFFPLPKNAGEMPAPQSAISSLRAKQLLITSGCVSI